MTLQDPFYSAAGVTREKLLTGRSLFGDQALHLTLPDDPIIDLDEAMRTYLAKEGPPNYGKPKLVNDLMEMMVNPANLGMVYDMSKTYTAQGAFFHSRGNCLAFSFLYTAFARAKGLRVSFREVDIPPQWDKVEGELYFLSRHVNVRVHLAANQDIIVDFDKVNSKPYYRAKKISDNKAFALYYSNIGTDYLIAKDYENAFRYFIKGLELWPDDSAIWSNLGLLYRVNGLYNYAEKAYLIALELGGPQLYGLTNLSALYNLIGQDAKAEYYFQYAQKRQMKNPYYRYHQALDAFHISDFALALNHLKAARDLDAEVYEIQALLGETYGKLGHSGRANKARAKARELLKKR